MESREIEDVHFYKDKIKETKPRMDDTRVSGREVATEKVTVTRTDGTRTEEIKRAKYPEEQRVGRIVIEEIPEQKEERPQGVYHRYAEKPRATDVTVTREVRDVARPTEKEEVVKVGKLNIQEMEKTSVESRRPEEKFLAQTERIEKTRKVCSKA